MTHYYSLQVFYEDTDMGGIVYHANYVKFMERARTCFLADKGFTLMRLQEGWGIQFVVRDLNVRFRQPVRLQQQLTVETKLTDIKRASLMFQQTLYLDPREINTMICSGEVNIVCTNAQLKPCAIPQAILRELTK